MEIVFCFAVVLVVCALIFWQVRSLAADLCDAREKLLDLALENVALRINNPYVQLYLEHHVVEVCRN